MAASCMNWVHLVYRDRSDKRGNKGQQNTGDAATDAYDHDACARAHIPATTSASAFPPAAAHVFAEYRTALRAAEDHLVSEAGVLTRSAVRTKNSFRSTQHNMWREV